MQESPVPVGLCRYKNPMLRRGNIATTAAVFCLWLFCSSVALAADSKEPQEAADEKLQEDVFVNPLDITTPLSKKKSFTAQPVNLNVSKT